MSYYSVRLFYGIHSVEHVLLMYSFKNIISLFIVPGSHKLEHLIVFARRNCVDINFITQSTANYFFKNQTHQNVILIARFFISSFEYLLDVHRLPYLILNGVMDPYNFGACIRSAVLFGITVLIVPKFNSCRITSVVCKAASGFLPFINIFYVSSVVDIVCFFTSVNIPVFGFDHLSNVFFQSFFIDKNCVFIFGSESCGLQQTIKDKCNQLLTIPTVHKGYFYSLNLSVSVGIVLFCYTLLHRKLELSN